MCATPEISKDPPHRLRQAVLIEGLVEIVYRSGIVGTQRVLAVRRHEYDGRPILLVDGLENAEPISVGHLDIEKYDVRLETPDGAHRFASIGGLPDHGYAAMSCQHHPETGPRKALVIYQQHAEWPVHGCRTVGAQALIASAMVPDALSLSLTRIPRPLEMISSGVGSPLAASSRS